MATALSDVVVHKDTNGIERAYRAVKRRADVGELVRFTKDVHGHGFGVGEIVAVVGGDENSECAKRNGLDWWFTDGEYEVLEPIGPSDLDAQDRITALEARVAQLERKVGGEHATSPSLMKTVQHIETRKAALTREEVIEKAKRDVQDFVTIYGHRIRLVENREKHTVVCLIRDGSEVVRRRKAKCAPDDCFNIHIGRAIALRRALGIPVPDYYVNAPKPKTPQVGDIVSYPDGRAHIAVFAEGSTDWRIPEHGTFLATARGARSHCQIEDDSHDYGGEGA